VVCTTPDAARPLFFFFRIYNSGAELKRSCGGAWPAEAQSAALVAAALDHGTSLTLRDPRPACFKSSYRTWAGLFYWNTFYFG